MSTTTRRPITMDRLSPEDAALQTSARDVAQALGWTYEVPTEDDDAAALARAYAHSARLVRGDGLAVHFRRAQTRGRYEIGHGLDVPHEVSRYGLTYPSITVAADREPAKIAAEISRRMVPDLEAFRAEVYERMRQANDYQARTEAGAAMIAAAGAERGSNTYDKSEVALYGPMSSHIRVSGSSARFEYFSVPHEVAAQIVALLREHAKKEAERSVEG